MRYDRIARPIFALLILLSLILSGVGSIGHKEANDEEKDGPSARESILAGPPSRDLEDGKTVFQMDGGDPDWVLLRNGVIQREEGLMKLDDRRIGGGSIFAASPESTYNMATSRMVQEYLGRIYAGYVVSSSGGGGNVKFYLISSGDSGRSWDGPVMVAEKSGVTTGSIDLLIQGDKVFYVMTTRGASAGQKEISVKVTSYLNWMNISSVPSHIVESGLGTHQTALVNFNQRVFLFWKRGDFSRPQYQVHYDGSWSTTHEIAINTKWFCPVFSDFNGLDTLYLLHVGGTANNDVYVTNTTDFGDTWSATVRLFSGSGELEYISAARGPGAIHLATSYETLLQIDHATYNGRGVTGPSKIAYFSANVQDNDPKEVCISADDRDVAVMYEDVGGKVMMVTKREGGYIPEISSFGFGSAHSPTMDAGRNAVCFMNGTLLEVRVLSRATRGAVYSQPLSNIGLSSWNDIGFTTGGLGHSSNITFKVLDYDTGDALFPQSGTVRINDLPPGEIEGRYHNNAMDLSGAWTEGGGLAETIVLMLFFERNERFDPWLMSMSVNYTVSYPYTEDFSQDFHFHSSMNVDITPIGAELIEGADSGWITMGPVRFEDEIPSHLSVHCSFLGNGNKIKAEVLDRNQDQVSNFGDAESSEVTETEKEVFVKWGRNNFGDIPTGLSMVFVRLHLIKDSPAAPAVKWFKLGPTEPPALVGDEADRMMIRRGQSASLYIEAADREEPLGDLNIAVECRAPDSNIWSDTMVSDPLWNGNNWTVLFMTDMSSRIGTYDFRAMVRDNEGGSSDWVELSSRITVLNNIPAPPMITIRPATARVGDDIEVSLLSAGSDRETASGELTYTLELYREEELHDTLSNLTSLEIVLEDLPLVKHETWTIEARTWDGVETGPWTTVTFGVENTEPSTTSSLPGIIHMEEDEGWSSGSIDTWFSDADGDELVISFMGPPELGISHSGDLLELSTPEDRFGPSFLWVFATDGEAEVEINISIDVAPVNDPPEWNPVDSVSVMQDEWLSVSLGAHDSRDGEDVLVSSDIREVIPGLLEGVNFIQYPNGDLELLASNAMVGIFNITYHMVDGDHDLTGYLEIEVVNVNDGPSLLSAGTSGGKRVFEFDELITFTAEADDPDLGWGDELSYEWSSDISGAIGTGDTISSVIDVGDHIITLRVTDNEGASNSTSFSITVLDDELDGGSVMRTSTLYMIAGGAAFGLGLLIAVIIIIVGFVTGKKKKKEAEEEKKEVPKEPEDRTPKLGPGGPENLKMGETAPERRQLPPAETPSESIQNDTRKEAEPAASSQHQTQTATPPRSGQSVPVPQSHATTTPSVMTQNPAGPSAPASPPQPQQIPNTEVKNE
ncbi:MAG: hypothetical protein ACMUIE_01435 [Thermoplasmatota archaeon]